MTRHDDYSLRQTLPPDVLVGGDAVWSRYRRYPVFGLRWLVGRTLLFCSIIAVVAAFIGAGTGIAVQDPGVALKVAATQFVAFSLQRLDSRRKILRPDQGHRPPPRGEIAKSAMSMLGDAAFQIVGVSRVIAAVGTEQDVGPKRHCFPYPFVSSEVEIRWRGAKRPSTSLGTNGGRSVCSQL